MLVLRVTRKLQSALPTTADRETSSDGALGDWYATKFVVDRRPLLMLISELSVFAIILPARDVRTLTDRIAAIVEERLRVLGIDPKRRAGAAASSATLSSQRKRLVSFSLNAGVKDQAID